MGPVGPGSLCDPMVAEEDRRVGSKDQHGAAGPYLVLVLSWFDRCNNQDHLSLPEL